MDLRIHYGCRKIVTEDGASHDVVTPRASFTVTRVDRNFLNSFQFWDSVKCAIADSLKKCPTLLSFKTDGNQWGQFLFTGHYHSVNSRKDELVELNMYNDLFCSGPRNAPIMVTEVCVDDDDCISVSVADIWIDVVVHLEKGQLFIDAVRRLINRLETKDLLGSSRRR